MDATYKRLHIFLLLYSFLHGCGYPLLQGSGYSLLHEFEFLFRKGERVLGGGIVRGEPSFSRNGENLNEERRSKGSLTHNRRCWKAQRTMSMNREPSKPMNSNEKLSALVHEHYSKERTYKERKLFNTKLKLILGQAYIEAMTAIYE